MVSANTQRTKPARRLDVAEPFTRSAATSALAYVKKTGTLKKIISEIG